MKKIEKLKQQVNELNKQINDIEYKKLIEVSIPELRKSIGRCFKYKNSYGGNLDKWWLYKKIISINEKDMTFNTLEFQITSLNIIEVKLEQQYNFGGKSYFDNQGTWYTEIKPSEFNKARKMFLKKIEKLINK